MRLSLSVWPLWATIFTVGLACGSNEEHGESLVDARRSALTSTCVPYAPTEGLFLTNLLTVGVPSWPAATAGPYQISRSSSAVEVRKNGQLAFTKPITSTQNATYLFFPVNAPRFLILEIHSTNATTVSYQVWGVDLAAFTNAVLPGYVLDDLSDAFTAPGPQFRVMPSSDGSAFYASFGGGGLIRRPRVFRSDTGAMLVAASDFSPSGQHNARILGGFAQILDAAGVRAQQALPKGQLSITPALLDFGSTTPTGSLDGSFHFTNTGNDCLSVTGAASSNHFQPVGFSPFNLAPGMTHAVEVMFQPAGASGEFTETLSVTRNPAQGANAMAATASACANLGTVTSCGTCGEECASPTNGTATCNNSTCGIQCNAGYANCGGVCRPTTSDPWNCGGCGYTCPGASSGLGVCSNSSCSCAENPFGSDPANCGTCGNVCAAPPGATATCNSGVCGWSCAPGYGLCGGSCVPTTPASGNGVCQVSDCQCGTSASYYCHVGPGACLPTTLLTKTFSLNQTIAWSGTSTATGAQGAFVAVADGTGTFSLPTKRNVDLSFAFNFTRPSGPSPMLLDVRILLDSVEVQRQRFGPGNHQFTARKYDVPLGSHTVAVEVRSVLDGGPPVTTTLKGYSSGAAQLSATVVRNAQ